MTEEKKPFDFKEMQVDEVTVIDLPTDDKFRKNLSAKLAMIGKRKGMKFTTKKENNQLTIKRVS